MGIFPPDQTKHQGDKGLQYTVLEPRSQAFKAQWIEQLVDTVNHVKRSKWGITDNPLGLLKEQQIEYWGFEASGSREGYEGRHHTEGMITGKEPNFLSVTIHRGRNFQGVKNPWVHLQTNGGNGTDMKSTNILRSPG